MAQTLREQLEARIAERRERESNPTGSVSAEPEQSDEDLAEAEAELDEHQDAGESQIAADDDDQSPERDDEDQADGEEEAREFYTPTDLAKEIGWEPEDIYQALAFPLGEDGTLVTLGEVKDRFERISTQEQALAQRDQELQQAYREFAQRQEQALTSLQGPSEEVTKAMAQIEQIKSQYASIDWDELRKQGGDVADTKLQFSTALSQAKARLGQAQQQAQQAAQEAQQGLARQHFGYLVQEPEFAPIAQDQQKLGETLNGLYQFAIEKMGFAPDEIASVVHHKAYKTLWYAAKGYEAMQAAQNAEKKLRGAPKPVMRPGSGKPKPDKRLAQVIARGKRKGASSQEKVMAAKAVLARKQSSR